MPAPSSPSSKLLYLEGLRGVAALLVLLAHLRGTFFWGFNDRLDSMVGPVPCRMLLALFDANAAVWVFWVMSAFVLSLRFHHAPATAPGNATPALLAGSTLRRYPRLLPPVLASVLFAWALHAGGLMSNQALADLLGPEYQAWLGSFYSFAPSLPDALSTAAWGTFFNYNPAETYNAVLWTMQKELLGSFFLFAFLALFGKHPARCAVYLVTAAVLWTLGLHWVNAFLFGTALCDAHAHRDALKHRLPARLRGLGPRLEARGLTRAVLFLSAVFLVSLPFCKPVAPLLLATGLTGFAVISPTAQRWLSGRFLVFLGKISFGLYLIHLPILCAAAHPIYTRLLDPLGYHPAALATCAALIALSLAGGWALWWIADRPAPRFAHALTRRLTPA